MRNGYYFDKNKGAYRINVSVRMNGRLLRRSRLLPKSTTEDEAAALADSIRASVMLENAGIKPDRRWEGEVQRAYATKGSWLHEMFNRARSRGKKKGVGCGLSLEDLRDICLRTKGRCELSGIAFSDTKVGEAKMRPFKPSLDRKNPALGYATDNCRLVCACINIALFSWGEEAFNSVAVGYVINRFLGPYTALIQRTNMANSLPHAAPEKG